MNKGCDSYTMRMNISEAVRTWAQRKGDELAISGTHNMTYYKLDSIAEIYARQIFNQTPPAHQKIAIITDDNIHFICYLLGIIRSGNIFVLINPKLSDTQINKSLETIHCEFYISDYPERKLSASQINVSEKNTEVLNEMISIHNTIGVVENAGVIFSSGTTGDPKAIMRNNFSLLSEIFQWIIELRLQRETTFLVPRPLYYTGGFILMCATLFSGGRVDLLDDISTHSVLNYTQKETNDWAFIVPSVIREINECKTDAKMAKNVLTMGSPIYHSEKMQFYQKFRCNLIEVWGNSEGLGTITEPSDLFEHPFSIGKPFFTDYLDIASSENKKEGVIFGISDNEFSEYIEKPELTSEVLKDGFIFSEDIGYQDDNGYFYLTGRAKDIIVINGIKVFPTDIEKILMQENGVVDCSIIGFREQNGNEVVSAVLVVKNGIKAEEVISKTNNILAPHERIKKHIVLESIPRNHGGKVEKEIILNYLNASEG